MATEPPVQKPEQLEQLAQARYERTLLQEITKLQAALAEERNSIAAHKAEVEDAASADRERKLGESERASRLQQMESAIEAAQKEEQKEFLKKREQKEKHLRALEAEAAKKRAIEAKKKEQHRQLAAKLHEETMLRAAEERAQAEESKRIADERKESKLRARLADERDQLLERNLRKAEESAEKVKAAAEQRIKMTEVQRAAYKERTQKQQQRMAEQKAAQDKRIAEIRTAAELKQQVIERAQQQQKAQEEDRRQSILQAEAEKERKLEVKAAREGEARRLLQHEKVLQEAAARGRVERTMGDLQAQLYALEGQLDARQDKVDTFTRKRDVYIEEGQRLSVASSLERSTLANSMSKMRSNLGQTTTQYIEMPQGRRGNVESSELQALLRRIDPDQDGHIPLATMRKTLTKLLPPPPEHQRRSARITSSSLPSLLTLEQQQNMDRYQQFVTAFKAVDTDNSGTISKRELYAVLAKAGLTNGKQALEVFSGFDEDGDGSLDFEEFQKIAKILC